MPAALSLPDSNETAVCFFAAPERVGAVDLAASASRRRSITRPADQRFLDAHVRCALGDRQREWPPLPQTSAHLIPGEIAGDVIDAVQRLEQIARSTHPFTSSPTFRRESCIPTAVKEKFSSIVCPPNAPQA